MAACLVPGSRSKPGGPPAGRPAAAHSQCADPHRQFDWAQKAYLGRRADFCL